MNCMLDIEIFTHAIAKALEINRRFVGTEESCHVTAAYNECLKQALPPAGIELVELKRMTEGTEPISASVVRRAWQSGNPQETKKYLPTSTYQWLEEKFPQ